MKSSPSTTGISRHIEHELTIDQQELISKFMAFLFEKKTVFIIKGYAGTGKTTLIGAIVKALPDYKLNAVLLAPTGRAAKVLSSYSGKKAFTIHKKIYRVNRMKGGKFNFSLRENKHRNTVFIVDEASMISDNSKGAGMNVLQDLLQFVTQGTNCRLVLTGDTAQLPPVGENLSPALNPERFKNRLFEDVDAFQMKEIVRQSAGSGILMNATTIRNTLSSENSAAPELNTDEYPDISSITGNELEDSLNEAYDTYGFEDTIVICRSNKRANLFNQQIRARIRWMEEEISSGDLLMVVKNNYFWLDDSSEAGFIANGDIIEVLKIRNTEEMYGFRFANVVARLVDYPGESEIEVKVLLDTIMTEAPALTQEQNKQLFNEIWNDHSDVKSKFLRMKKMKEDPFLNALQVKFAYAVTCHKAQGGQWKAVFIDQGFFKPDMLDSSYLRWLYTAFTRATERLYLVNFHQLFFEKAGD